MNVFSLFSGVGGLELGLERAGMTTVGQVEINPYCRAVLTRHWPEVPQHDDVRTAIEWWRQESRPRVDLVCGGFPCPPFSNAGLRRGIEDDRWAWPWMVDIVRAIRPRYVLVENVAALLDHPIAFGVILADLAELGFDAEWSVLSACAMGAPHTRERLFLVAYTNGANGQAGLGAWPQRSWTLPDLHDRASAWRDRVGQALATPSVDDREIDGSARRLVAMAGNAVVPQVAEFVGRLIIAHPDAERAA